MTDAPTFTLAEIQQRLADGSTSFDAAVVAWLVQQVGVGRTDEYYLTMAALDDYPIDDGLPKSTSVVFRIHQLGHALAAARSALQAIGGTVSKVRALLTVPISASSMATMSVQAFQEIEDVLAPAPARPQE